MEASGKRMGLVAGMLLLASQGLASAAKSPATLKAEFASLFGADRYARIVWQRDNSGGWPGATDNPVPNSLMALDTKDGVVRVLVPNTDKKYGYMARPTWTWDGKWVVFTDLMTARVYRTNWEGTVIQHVATGFESGGCWQSPDGKQWVVANSTPANGLWRLNLDNPAERVKMHSRKNMWPTMSPDGAYVAALWPEFGAAGVLKVATGEVREFKSPAGCWPTMMRDGTNQVLYTIEPHTHVRKVTVNEGEVYTKAVNPSLFAGPIEEYNILRGTTDPDIMSLKMDADASFPAPIISRISTQKFAAINDKPTMNEGNCDLLFYSGSGAVEGVEAPIFEPQGISFRDSIAVRIVAGAGAQIRYTLDGKEPAATSATYSTPLILKATTTVKARAFLSGKAGPTATATYTRLAGANRPPTVNAGPDATVGLGQASFRLAGEVDDDGGASALKVAWKQVSGGSAAQLATPDAPVTLATFPALGTYGFELSADDGQLARRDTVLVTVVEALPFQVLAPANGQGIVPGQSFQVRWQMDPPVACRISVSTDQGRTWEIISVGGAVGADGKTEFTWKVGAAYRPGTEGLLRVSAYSDETENAVGSFRFVPPSSATHAPRLRPEPRILLELPDRAHAVPLHAGSSPVTVSLYGKDGRLVFRGRPEDGRIRLRGFPDLSRGILFYRAEQADGGHVQGRVLY